MLPRKQLPLAWLNLMHDRRRLGLSVAGISVAVLLMLVEVGFWLALLEGQAQLIHQLNADLVVISTAKTTLPDGNSFPRSRLSQARAVPGVASAQPLYIRYAPFVWKNRPEAADLPPAWPIRVLAFEPDPDHFAFVGMPELKRHLDRLEAPDVAFMDTRSRPFYDVVRLGLLGRAGGAGVDGEVAGRSLHLAGTFRLGTDFTTDGSLIMTARNLARFYPGEGDTLESVQVGLIELAPGADRGTVLRALRESLPREDVRVLTRREFLRRELWFWQTSTPVGFVFGLGLAVGFVVGVVICYQVLTAEVSDRLSEYATLKAIGYADGQLSRVVLRQALWLSGFGFILGLGLSWPLYAVLADRTGLPLELTWPLAGVVLVLTVAMCTLSGSLALRRVRHADPAEVFG